MTLPSLLYQLALLPLGQAADGGVVANGDGQDAANEEINPGDFVANDLIDEGVKLLSKYQHGTPHDERQPGPGTRSRRAAVNVICVARCPLGNQFATGSDDGICRVWRDYDDDSVALIDRRFTGRSFDTSLGRTQQSRPLRTVEDKPLLKLTGHVSTITDLSYSHAGDRILSASQKDGIVRVWNVGIATESEQSDKRVTQTVIKLVDPFAKKSLQQSRRRPANNATRSATSKVSCDVAVWTHDDSQIITSQCVLMKQSGSEIQPGSQFLFLWDSRSGHCLIGISGAHKMQCPVIIPHPMDNSIMCTAAADGSVKVWDWTQGKCIFSHQNKVEYGPPDPNNPNRIGGFLDGAFSPDGTIVVLTDDNGQITVLDSIAKQDDPPNHGNDVVWMREQYFANDYYDLAYDVNGYCIEKGSERPPHLAPKGARCTHNGAPYSDEVNETFRKLSGPIPLPEDSCRWLRDEIRARRIEKDSLSIPPLSSSNIRIGVREFDPLSTLIIKGMDHVDNRDDGTKSNRSKTASLFGSGQAATSGNSSTRNLSANYRYLDYDDLIQREGEHVEQESDDEDFEPVARGRRANNNHEESDDDNIDDFSMESDEDRPSRRRNRTRRKILYRDSGRTPCQISATSPTSWNGFCRI